MATRSRMRAKRRLTPEDWIRAAIEGLLKRGAYEERAWRASWV
jgi:hypothetical protein